MANLIFRKNGTNYTIDGLIAGTGHIIKNSSGQEVNARQYLQFNGAYLGDDSVGDATEVNVVRTMTQAQFNNLSAAEKEGLIYISDAAGQLTASEVALAAIAGMSATTVQSGVAELNTSINSLITSVNAKTPYVNLGGQSGIESAWDALAIYDQPVVGRFTKSGYWWFIGLKYTGGQYGMMIAQPYYSTTIYSLSVSGGVKTVGTFGARTVTTLVDEAANISAGGNKTYATLTASALSAYDEIWIYAEYGNTASTGSATKAQIAAAASYSSGGVTGATIQFFGYALELSGTMSITQAFGIKPRSTGLQVFNNSVSSTIGKLLIEGITY